MFPKLSGGLLPQISGFLIIGVLVGPYVTNLVCPYHIFLIGKLINRLSLSFIAGAAGAEIFLPELISLIGPMLLQVTLISLSTVFICTVGLLTLDSLSVVSIPPIHEQTLFASKACVSLLAAALMTARSPASAIAVISEMQCNYLKSSKVILGITVLGDIVVLILFALCTNLTRVVTEGGSFGLGVIMGVVLELVVSCLLGALTSQALRLLIPYEEAEHDTGSDTDHASTAGVIKLALRGALLIGMLFATFMVAHNMADWTNGALHLESLLACTVASCICGHDKGRRHGLEQALRLWTPVVLLPFFTLAGASLQLMGLMQVLPAAFSLVVLRMASIALGSFAAGKLSVKTYPELGITPTSVNCIWLTLLAQAGVTLGLVLEVQDSFEGWGNDFGVLVIGVVVLNQLIGPILCRVGLQLIVKVEGDSEAKKDDCETELIEGGLEKVASRLLSQESTRNGLVSRTMSDPSRIGRVNVALMG